MRMSLWPRLSWRWAVLLSSDNHRKSISSSRAVLLTFVTYLLTLPRNSVEVSGTRLAHKSLKLETQFTTDDRRQCLVRRLKLLGASLIISCMACGRQSWWRCLAYRGQSAEMCRTLRYTLQGPHMRSGYRTEGGHECGRYAIQLPQTRHGGRVN
jgi:hypothetical protein